MTHAAILLAALILTVAQAPAPPESPATPAPPATPGPAIPAMIPLPNDDAASILGRQVLDRQGQAAGRITDVLVDATGVVRAAVVDFGGFLGVGQRRIAVAWSALRFDPATHAILLTIGAPELAAAPDYKPTGTNLVATPTKDVPRPSALPPPPSSGTNTSAAPPN